ncbi:MAG: transglycosylase family protein [Mycobacteriales bacterium]
MTRTAHTTSRRVWPVFAVTVATVLAGLVLAWPAKADPSAGTWARLRACESGGDYRRHTGRYTGAYQFDARTWHALGGKGQAYRASPVEQDRRALALWRKRGWQPWHACARKLGLVKSRSRSAPRPLVGRPPAPLAPADIGTPAAWPWGDPGYGDRDPWQACIVPLGLYHGPDPTLSVSEATLKRDEVPGCPADGGYDPDIHPDGHIVYY